MALPAGRALHAGAAPGIGQEPARAGSDSHGHGSPLAPLARPHPFALATALLLGTCTSPGRLGSAGRPTTKGTTRRPSSAGSRWRRRGMPSLDISPGLGQGVVDAGPYGAWRPRSAEPTSTGRRALRGSPVPDLRAGGVSRAGPGGVSRLGLLPRGLAAPAVTRRRSGPGARLRLARPSRRTGRRDRQGPARRARPEPDP